jgi:hypothetical protein
MVVRAAVWCLWLAASAAPARADATAFAGVTTASTARPTFGVAWGRCPGVIGFEIEFARTIGTATEGQPSLSTVGASLIVQMPATSRGPQFYGIGGLGAYGESLGNGRGSTGLSGNVGAGAKFPLGGHLNLRVDYRFFLLNDSAEGLPVFPRPHRFSTGLSLAF